MLFLNIAKLFLKNSSRILTFIFSYKITKSLICSYCQLNLRKLYFIVMDDIDLQIQRSNHIQQTFKQFTIYISYRISPQKTVVVKILNGITSEIYEANVDSTFIASDYFLNKYF